MFARGCNQVNLPLPLCGEVRKMKHVQEWRRHRDGGGRGSVPELAKNASGHNRFQPACPARPAAGFTLIELLIVVAVVGVLISIMAPVFGRMSKVTRRLQCQAGLHQLALGWMEYTRHNNNQIPSSDTGSWAGSWVDTDHFGNSRLGAEKGSIFPYVGAYELYRCQSSYFDYYVTYGANSHLNGQHISAGYRRGTNFRMSDIPNPAGTFILIEEYDNRGNILGSFAPFQDSAYHWWDVVAGNHEGGDNLNFVDGHVEYWVWQDPNTLSFGGGHGAIDLGSVDCDRLRAALFGDDKITPGY